MSRPITRRVLALVLFAAAAAPARASEVYQISTISGLLAGGYDGDTTVGELVWHGGFGLGTFNGVDGEMMVGSGGAADTTTTKSGGGGVRNTTGGGASSFSTQRRLTRSRAPARHSPAVWRSSSRSWGC